jgi:ABC-type multidrug transport system ATPase subunit
MPLLRMREAGFTNARVSVGPMTLDLEPGQSKALRCATPREATVLALMAAGVAKASTGSVLIGDFDPRVQSVHCKRIAGFVPHAPLSIDEAEFPRYIAYRAALWNVEPELAVARAREILRQLDGMHEALAYPLVGALIASPQLLVMDRPPPVYARQILAVTGNAALLTTHADAAGEKAFRQ